MASCVYLDADSFEPDEPIKKPSGNDKWEGEDEEEDVKVCFRNFASDISASVRAIACNLKRNFLRQELVRAGIPRLLYSLAC